MNKLISKYSNYYSEILVTASEISNRINLSVKVRLKTLF